MALALNHLFVKAEARVPSSDVKIMVDNFYFPEELGFSA